MLTGCVINYLAIRRAVGFKLDTVETYLRSFADFATARGDVHVVGQTAIDWASHASSESSRASRLDAVIRFARFVRAEDSCHEIPRDHIFCGQRQRRIPYLFTDDEVARLLRETAKLGPDGSLRPHTYGTIFGLLATTGMRISEALALCLDDITRDGLVIRQTKFRKQRLVPIHPSTVAALDLYLEHRRRVARGDWHVFISHRGGGRLGYDIVAETFQEILAATRIADQPTRSRPRLHDFRHRVAVRALASCPDSRDRVTRHMLALSTFLGHARMESTYWYLDSTPELMADIAGACETFLPGDPS